MSGIQTISKSRGLTTYPQVATPCGLQALPVELLIVVMKHLPDMAALSRLFTACSYTFIIFKRNSNDIFASIVKKISPELRSAALDVLAVRSRSPIHRRLITSFIEQYLNVHVYDAQSGLSSYSLSALLDLITVSESIESLTESFARDRVLGPCMRNKMSLSPIELHRIRRSFWRFQLCYDMCHPEDMKSSWKCRDVKSRSTRQYVQYQTDQPINSSVPGWIQCRGEAHRPEALSRFLPNLSRWEHDELEAIRFHLAHEVNTVQYRRSCASEDELIQVPVLLQRLVRDIDHWNPASPEDHFLVASFRQTRYSRQYPVVWNRLRELYGASFPNTARRLAMHALQEGHPQWGWCLWDEERLVKRGMIDPEYEDLVKRWKKDDKSQTARIYEWRAIIGRAHRECIDAQYTLLDRHIAEQYDIDAQIHADRTNVGHDLGIGS